MEQAETEMLSVLHTNSPNYRLDYLFYAPSIECMYAMRKGARAIWGRKCIIHFCKKPVLGLAIFHSLIQATSRRKSFSEPLYYILYQKGLGSANVEW